MMTAGHLPTGSRKSATSGARCSNRKDQRMPRVTTSGRTLAVGTPPAGVVLAGVVLAGVVLAGIVSAGIVLVDDISGGSSRRRVIMAL